jgi:hypothetical protein
MMTHHVELEDAASSWLAASCWTTLVLPVDCNWVVMACCSCDGKFVSLHALVTCASSCELTRSCPGHVTGQ